MRVFVSAGTDLHPFDRLVEWADEWAVQHPEDDVVVQYGTSRAPVHAEGHELFGRAEMQRQLSRADVVVISGGPGGVMDARRAGRLPGVAPRDPRLGEHVDGHQQAFARHLDRHGLARVVGDLSDFESLVDEVRRAPEAFEVPPDTSEPEGIARVGRLIDGLVWD